VTEEPPAPAASLAAAEEETTPDQTPQPSALDLNEDQP